MKPFVHLHVHTTYSLLDGACRVSDLVAMAAGYGMPAVAMTDHGVMYGTVDFYKAARDAGLTPIIGSEVYITPGSRFDRKGDGSKAPNHHLVLLATDTVGYQNLARLVSAAHIEGFYYKPRIDREILREYHKGLIGLSACLKGEVSECLDRDDLKAGIATASEYAEILGKENFFLEVMDHGIPEQRKVNRLLLDVSARTGLPLVLTNDVHYLKREHAEAHEVLLCLQTQTVMSDPKRMRYRTDEFYFKNADEMAALARDFPQALDRTLEIAERCNLELEFGVPHFPTFDAPQGATQKEHLVRMGLEGLRRHCGIEDPAHPRDDREREILTRFHHEIAVIEKTGFVNYFLVVWDFVRFARESGIPVGPGRGSGGGSLVAYALGITAIDPLRYQLVFERFLNPERRTPPDFDIDFCQTRRGEVIDYVKRKYGRENVAQIITFGSLGAKTVIRDVGRVLEIPYSKCDALSKMVPEDPKIKLKAALEMNPDLQRSYASDADCRRILDFGFVLEGLYRNPSTHAAGVVIGDKPLIEIIPLSRDKDGEFLTQYTMEPLGELGLLKMDFLGLKTLTVLHEAVELIRECQDRDVDIDRLPLDDKPTYELLNRGDTVGVFQLESSGMRDLIRRVGIDCIEDLIAMIALYRPGPMRMLPDYVERKSGRAKVRYDHPALEPILRETHGVMVYQEQVQNAAHILAGFSLGDADNLRRAMTKKKPEAMEEERTRFVKGCARKNGMDPDLAGRIFAHMAQFAGYGFNKAHSAGYAIISYQTAFLKANYPAEFMAALLSSEIGNSDKLPVLMAEAVEMGIEIRPPDVNESRARFLPSGRSIRFGLAGVKNVGEGAAQAIAAERAARGPYKDLVDFCSRLDTQSVNKKTIESLARCGAFDGFGLHRARVFGGIDFAIARAAEAARDRVSGQGSLFDLMAHDRPQAAADLPEQREWHENELLAAERELLGIYLTGHPLTQYASLLARYQLCDVKGLDALKDKAGVRLGGIVSGLRRTFTKSKESMAILQLEDLDGNAEVVVFPDAYQKYATRLEMDSAILVCGELSVKENARSIHAVEIYPLADAPRHFAVRLGIHIPATHLEDDRIARIKDMLRRYPGNTPVVVCLQYPDGAKVFVAAGEAFKVCPEEQLILELEREVGEKGVYVAVNPKPFLNPRPTRGARSAGEG